MEVTVSSLSSLVNTRLAKYSVSIVNLTSTLVTLLT